MNAVGFAGQRGGVRWFVDVRAALVDLVERQNLPTVSEMCHDGLL